MRFEILPQSLFVVYLPVLLLVQFLPEPKMIAAKRNWFIFLLYNNNIVTRLMTFLLSSIINEAVSLPKKWYKTSEPGVFAPSSDSTKRK